MKSVISQFYSLFREAMHANKKSAADISATKGVHYTYVYNSVRNNANLTLQTADELATAAGYHMTISFEPLPGSEKLVGNMDPQGPLFSDRRRKNKPAAAAPAPAAAPTTPAPTATAVASLDADVEELLASI